MRYAGGKKIVKSSTGWMNWVAPSGYMIVSEATPTGYYLTREDRPYGIQKSHLKYDDAEELCYPLADEELVEYSANPLSFAEANKWICAVNWKVPHDPIPLVLSPVNVASHGVDISKVHAMEELFSETQLHEDSIIKFCSQFGFLGQNTYLLQLPDESFIWGESLQEWIAEIYKMRLLRKLWENIIKRESDDVLYYFANYDVDLAFINHERLISWPAASGELNEEFDLRFIEPDQDADGLVYRTAKTVFHGLLRRAIRRTCNPDFALERGAQIELEPKGFLGAVYMRFLDEVLTQSKPIRRCEVCGEYFDLFDIRAKYCSPRCKQKAYRNKARLEKDNGK